MKNFESMFMAATLMLASSMTSFAFADETIAEEIKVSANDAKRGIKKVSHRAQEAMCGKGLKCAGEKIKNRTEEVKDATVDGAKNIKNKID